MKVLLISVFCVSAIFAAPAIDKDVRELETNDLGTSNEVDEYIPLKTTESNQYTSIQTIQEVTHINKICMEQTKVDKNSIHLFITQQIIPKDSEYPKFLECSYRKQKYLNEKGEIQMQNILRFLSKYYKKEDLKVLNVCGELKQTEKGAENAINALKCILPKLIPLQEIFDE